MTLLTAALLAISAPAPAKCTIPTLEVAGPDKALIVNFAPGTKASRQAEANVATAFAAACAKGLLAGSRIPSLDGVSTTQLALENWPDANVATLEADQLTGGTGWRLMLGYPFVASDGSVNVPSADEIEEAIYCAVRGATEQEQAETGRCLPD